ncbi:MAG: T6SS immunity protein Tdi1 domain-containing protein [Planctomycetota bacterium]
MFGLRRKKRFDRFRKNYQVSKMWLSSIMDYSVLYKSDETLRAFLEEFGGKSYNRGIYRVCAAGQIEAATERMERAFPDFKGRIICFGYDWLGSHFALDTERKEDGEPLVLLFDLGLGQALEIPVTLADFHDKELIDNANDAVALESYKEWYELNKIDIPRDQCVGYKIPLFLNGQDEVENMELIDLDVYVEICGQLLNKIKTLPDGTTIRDITIA